MSQPEVCIYCAVIFSIGSMLFGVITHRIHLCQFSRIHYMAKPGYMSRLASIQQCHRVFPYVDVHIDIHVQAFHLRSGKQPVGTNWHPVFIALLQQRQLPLLHMIFQRCHSKVQRIIWCCRSSKRMMMLMISAIQTYWVFAHLRLL